jgi:hypothetical protein
MDSLGLMRAVKTVVRVTASVRVQGVMMVELAAAAGERGRGRRVQAWMRIGRDAMEVVECECLDTY